MVDVDLHKIILLYLQPYELAVLTQQHTDATYINAAEHKNLEYLQLHKCSDMNAALVAATTVGDIDCVSYILNVYTPKYFNEIMILVIRYKHQHLIKYFLKLRAKNYEFYLSIAAASGNLGAVILFIKCGAKNLDYAMRCALAFGHLSIVKFIHTIGGQVTLDFLTMYNLQLMVWLCVNKFAPVRDTTKYAMILFKFLKL